MAHRQTWSLSQDANKDSGVCSVCHAVRQVHLKDGTLHLHGPLKNRCPGSNKPPLQTISASCSQPVLTPVSPATSTAPAAAAPVSARTFSHPQVNCGLIKHIPKSARPACATLLSANLNKVVNTHSDLAAWDNLLQFASRILFKPARTGRRHNLATVIKKRTEEGNCDLSERMSDVMSHGGRKRNADELLAAAVAAKIEDGNIKAAVRMLSTEEKPATDIDATYNKLLERHPAQHPDRQPAADPSEVLAIQVTEEDVIKAVRTFPAGSAGGPDGLRPQHLLDLVNNRESGPALLTSLTAFVNMLLEGKCDPAVTPVLFGGGLITLEKNQTHRHRIHTSQGCS